MVRIFDEAEGQRAEQIDTDFPSSYTHQMIGDWAQPPGSSVLWPDPITPANRHNLALLRIEAKRR